MSTPSFAQAARALAGVSAWALGWRPDEFWRATPDELTAALHGHLSAGAGGHGGPDVAVPPDAQTLAMLMARFPD